MHQGAHIGKNIRRIRELRGMKQEALALELGLSQQTVSALEQRLSVEDELLERVAATLKVPANAIRHFDEEKLVTLFSPSPLATAADIWMPATMPLNPVEKWVEALEENRKLYERLLKAEQEKVALLERVLGENRLAGTENR